MAAIAYPELDRRPRAPRPHLVLVPPHRPAGLRAPSRRVALRRRRLIALAALVVFVLVLQLAVHTASAWLGSGSLAAPEPRPAAAGSVYVVQPGDTLWTLARRAQPNGDLRPLVGRLAAAHDGRPLQAGQRIVLP